MFFNPLVLTKKGPLGKIWLAAHYRKKLSKRDIINVNVSESVEAILDSRVLLSLRTSSHLLVGISYLLHRQASYLLSDALDYAYRIPQFVLDKGIDLDDQSTGDVNMTVEEYDFDLNPETHGLSEIRVTSVGQNRILGDASELISEEFDDIEIDVLRGGQEESIHVEEIYFEDRMFTDDGFGGNLDQDPTTVFDIHGPSTSNATGEVPDQQEEEIQQSEKKIDGIQEKDHVPDIVIDLFDIPTQPIPTSEPQAPNNPKEPLPHEALNVDFLEPVAGPSTMEEPRRPSSSRFSRIGSNEEDLVLEPLDESNKRSKRQRAGRLLIDRVTSIPRERTRSLREDQGEPERAPHNKYLMMTKITGTATSLLNNPSTKYVSPTALKLFQSRIQAGLDYTNIEELSETFDANQPEGAPEEQAPPDFELPSVIVEKEIIADPPAPVIQEEQANEEAVIEAEPAAKLKSSQKRGEPVPQPSQERASQRRRKRPRLSQEQARRGTLHEPEILSRESIIEFEKTQMDVDPPQEILDFFPESQTTEFSSSPDEGLLSQLSQTLSDRVTFSSVTQDFNRKRAALTFFQLLTLHKQCVITLEQEEYYDEIYIKKGPNFRATPYVY